MNMLATVGHNRAPGPIESAKEAMTELGAWLREHPVIQAPEEAKNGAAYIERTNIALKDMETERAAKVKPLNDELRTVNGAYKIVRDPLERLLGQLKARLTAYATAIEAARIAEATRLRQEAEERERIAREAEAREQDAIACADVGECADVGAAIEQADQAFGEFQKAGRQAAVAEKNVPVRLGSIMGGRAQSMHNNKVLVVDDPHAALKAMWPNERIVKAIELAAKDFKEAYGEFPPGVSETIERSF